MAAIDMPASPTVNQAFEAQNGVSYIWDGEKWNAASSEVAVAVAVTPK